VSETIASETMAMNLVGEGARESAVVVAAPEEGGARSSSDEKLADEEADAEQALEIDVEEIPLPTIPPPAPTGFPVVAVPPPAPTGFQAFLQHANLHNLLQIESMSHTTGVFLVVSQGRRGYLHLSKGELIHAECGHETGERAAMEILSWGEGEFKSCARPLASAATVLASLPALLLRLARDTDEAAQSERRPPVPRPIEEDKPTEPHLPVPSAEARGSAPPRSSRMPPPLPPRIERDPANVAEVAISPSGEVVSSRGQSPDEFSARVAYAARLADLIGRAIRSGTPRALELRGKGTQTTVKWQPDGGLSATLELVQSPKIR
jgi:uncharacterized protein DUF4388